MRPVVSACRRFVAVGKATVSTLPSLATFTAEGRTTVSTLPSLATFTAEGRTTVLFAKRTSLALLASSRR